MSELIFITSLFFFILQFVYIQLLNSIDYKRLPVHRDLNFSHSVKPSVSSKSTSHVFSPLVFPGKQFVFSASSMDITCTDINFFNYFFFFGFFSFFLFRIKPFDP